MMLPHYTSTQQNTLHRTVTHKQLFCKRLIKMLPHHTTTHCNILHHTAKHQPLLRKYLSKTLPHHTATDCNRLQQNATNYNRQQHTTNCCANASAICLHQRRIQIPHSVLGLFYISDDSAGKHVPKFSYMVTLQSYKKSLLNVFYIGELIASQFLEVCYMLSSELTVRVQGSEDS